MAKKIEIVGVYFQMTDTISGNVEIHELTRNVKYRPTADRYSFINEKTGGFYSEAKSYLWTDFVDSNGSAFASESALVTFLSDNAGKSNASGLGADSFHGGWVDYSDSATAGSPIVVLSGVPTLLTNDGAGAFTNEAYLPMGVTAIYDKVDSFDWSQLRKGDMIDIRIDVSLTTISPNTTVQLNLHLGTGAGSYTIPFVTDADFKSTGTHSINKYNGIYMGDDNTLDNGGQLMITCDKSSTAVVVGWYCKIIMRG